MLNNITLDQVLFMDIETVSGESRLDQVPNGLRQLWRQKGARFARSAGLEWDDEVAADLYREKAAIFAEFGRIVVISAGFLFTSAEGLSMKIKSFVNPDERRLLEDFNILLQSHFYDPEIHCLCGHNIREFDVPYLCRRMLIHGIELPGILDVTGKKPWETKHFLDTMELWKFGDYKHFTSLNLLARILGVPTPKDDIDGSDVGRVYWDDNDIERIAVYCEKDVATVAQVFLKFRGQDPLPPERIHTVERTQTGSREEE